MTKEKKFTKEESFHYWTNQLVAMEMAIRVLNGHRDYAVGKVNELSKELPKEFLDSLPKRR